MAVAVAADLEGTLTTGRTWRGLGRYLVLHGRGPAYRTMVLRNLPAVVAARLARARGARTREQWLRQLLALFAETPAEAFDEAAEWVVDEVLWPARRREVVAALRVHQAAGERLVVASGAFEPVVEAFVRRLRRETGAAPMAALGTRVAVQGGRLVGAVQGPINVGDAKARRLHEALGSERLYAAYGDSADDVPMLMMSDRPVAVYPDAVLRGTASELGWSVFEP